VKDQPRNACLGSKRPYQSASLMRSRISISAKRLGEVALPSFCERCFWLRHRLGNKLPYQIFPGIFSSIDSYTRKVVHRWFDQHGTPPPWLAGLGAIGGYREPPHYSKFNHVEERLGIQIRGSPDAIFIRRDGSHLIADYNTARFTDKQDQLFPMYEAQLNAYALIGERRGLAPVSELALIYMEPFTDEEAAASRRNRRENGFAMEFSAHVLSVTIDPKRLRDLLVRVREICDRAKPPPSRSNCGDCRLVEQLVAIGGRARPNLVPGLQSLERLS